MRNFAGLYMPAGKIIVLVLGVVFFLYNPSSADILNDLQPVNGYVVKAGNEEIIIDLDTSDGIAVGDIFSVLGPGEKLVHPVTQKVIGRLEKVKVILRVVRVNDGFSFARPLGKTDGVKRGDPIQRFSSLTAIFWDYSDQNKTLYDQLQASLPSLKWQEYQISQNLRPEKPSPQANKKDALYFIILKNALEVRDPDFGMIRQYSLNDTASALKIATALPLVDRSYISEKPKPVETTALSGSSQPAVIDYGSARRTDQLTSNTLMAAYLRNGDRNLLAATDGKIIRVFNQDDKLELIAKGNVKRYGQILTVKWWQPEPEGPLYLTALAWTDDTLDSTIFLFDGNSLVVAASGLNTILGSFDLDYDGRPETLLSQEFDPENFFGRRIHEAYWQASALKYKKFTLQLPPKFTVIGGQLADLTGDGKLEAAYIRSGTLWVYSGKKMLYTSSGHMGGSLSVLTYKVDPTVVDYRTTSVFFEVTPIAVDLDTDGRRELLAVSSNQSSIKMPGVMSTIDRSHIKVFNYENGSFVKGTVGEPVEAAIQGLEVDGDQLLFIATDTVSPLADGGASRLQAINLAF